MAVTWNPSDKSADISLSGGDLTATADNTAWKSVRATAGYSTGKRYCEIVVNSTAYNHALIGVGTTSATLAGLVGSDAYGWGYNNNSLSRKFHNNLNDYYGTSYTFGDVIGICVDMDAGLLWWSKNGAWQASGDPSAGTGAAYAGLSGTIYPMYSPYATGHNATLRCLASSFSYSPPSGFSAWETVAIPTATGALVAGSPGISGDAIRMLQALAGLSAANADIAGATIKTVNSIAALQAAVPVIIGQAVIYGRQYAVGVLSSSSAVMSGQLVRHVIADGALVADAALIAGIARQFSLAHVDRVLIAEQQRLILVLQSGDKALAQDAGVAVLIENQPNTLQVEQ